MNTFDPTSPVPRNAAILRCYQAEKRSRRESKSKGRSIVLTQISADLAYRKALPELIGYDNIRDFIAAVTHGMVLGTLTAFQAKNLLAGARLALSALREAPSDSEKNNKQRPKTAADQEPAPPEAPQGLRYPQ